MKYLLTILTLCIGLQLALAISPEAMQEADLLFTAPREHNHITEVTSRDSVLIDHVAIFHRIGGLNGLPCVIEATPRSGVCITPLDSFLLRHKQDRILHARLSCPFNVGPTISKALTYVGRPYDHYFGATDSAIYCSELVLLSYSDASGSPIFSHIPMTFRNAVGIIPDFWVRHYRDIGQDVPEGEPGSNPAALLANPLILLVSE